jgi:hypothetical protein
LCSPVLPAFNPTNPKLPGGPVVTTVMRLTAWSPENGGWLGILAHPHAATPPREPWQLPRADPGQVYQPG